MHPVLVCPSPNKRGDSTKYDCLACFFLCTLIVLPPFAVIGSLSFRIYLSPSLSFLIL